MESTLQELDLERHISKFQREAISLEVLGDLTLEELEGDLGLSKTESERLMHAREETK